MYQLTCNCFITKLSLNYDMLIMKGGESMKYLLFDVYETENEFGELICESDDIEEIRQAAKLRREETDGECELHCRELVQPTM